MLAILSPAKTLDFESDLATKKFSEPGFVAESQQLIQQLRQLAPNQIGSLMKISDKLAELNHRRYAEWRPDFSEPQARAAILAFKGDVYLGLDGQSLSERDFNFAQKHLRILSGLHGLLRPLDRIHPYRLEMGTKLSTQQGHNLYEFWGNKVTCALNEALAVEHGRKKGRPVLINLASQEYYKVLHPEKVNARIINVDFREKKDGNYRFLSFFAKKARGTMSRYMIDHRVQSLTALREFDYDGYTLNDELSHGDNWVFTRG